MKSWLLLTYRVPRSPTSSRVYVWRKLKRLGALLLYDSVWILPTNSSTREKLQWLATEIEELEGEVTIWESNILGNEKERYLIDQFHTQVEAPYKEMLHELKKTKPDKASIARRYQVVKEQDYFQSELGKKVKAMLLSEKGEPNK